MCGFVSDSRVPPAQVVNHVARLVSTSEHTAGFHNLLGDADIDRFTHIIIFFIFRMGDGTGRTGTGTG